MPNLSFSEVSEFASTCTGIKVPTKGAERGAVLSTRIVVGWYWLSARLSAANNERIRPQAEKEMEDAS